jgi:catechol 2,3-dioxygenase-like lactoylglutathione lyase family enzyme
MTIAPAKFVHVVYRTRRFDEMIEWYKTVFGARVQYQDPGLAFLTYDDEHHRFAFANMALLDPTGGGPDDRGPIGVDHVAYTYASLADLFDQYAELKAEGITPYWCIHHGITVSMYYGDPDGNQMEFQVDCFADNEDANAFMRRSFAVNPIGVEYDPDAWLADLRSGTPATVLLARTTDLPVSPIRSARSDGFAAPAG